VTTTTLQSGRRNRIWDERIRLTQGAFTIELDSHQRQISRLEKTFQLITPLKDTRDAALVKYRLTEKGRKLYSESRRKIIEPLCEFLTDSGHDSPLDGQ
jgi:hypothetical protein